MTSGKTMREAIAPVSNKLVGATIRFKDAILEIEGYPQPGMCAEIVGVRDHSHFDVVEADYSKFDYYNRDFESSNYCDTSGKPCLTARQAEQYDILDELRFGKNDPADRYFEILGYMPQSFSPADALQAVSYLRRLYCVVSMNMGEMKPETHAFVKEVGAWLEKSPIGD